MAGHLKGVNSHNMLNKKSTDQSQIWALPASFDLREGRRLDVGAGVDRGWGSEGVMKETLTLGEGLKKSKFDIKSTIF